MFRGIFKDDVKEIMSMKKKLLAIALVAMMGMTACGKSESKDEGKSDTKTETTTEAETTTEEDTTEAEETTEEETEEDTTSAEMPEYDEFKLVDGLSENYIDFDNRAFAYDEKIYKLGESTLQDLIDGGIPFDEGDLNNIDNNVNSNYETSTYTVDINDYTSLQFKFMNATDAGKKEKECPLSYVRWSTIYTPHDDYPEDINRESIELINDCAKHVGFSFPLTLTKSELLEKAPEDAEADDYGTVECKKKSDVYIGSSGYRFSFDKDTEQLKDVSITWMP